MGDVFRGISVLVVAAFAASCSAPEREAAAESDGAIAVSLKPTLVREVDPMRGRTAFVEKGCVICHSVNGVGGKAAPALDAEIGAPAVDPLDFAARMWRGAPAMIELQAIELGYTIYLTADDIADLAAFAADRDAQKSLKLDELSESIRAGFLDERFWEVESWDDDLGAIPEGEFGDEAGSLPVETE